ncbi:transporter substrate-binding domain-containing protein [Pseudomonas cremoricolorata]|uniref:histidine kinase n=1 Tax=Pseudomonas cremoricolorata TaxID=157783 RepID=A0A089WYJ7_9PSED|nr:transporter substrate-binding domain-containing protein [Pseudomonas cremoricolorata]AIR91707.1 histidine kinase [Pseudomonas cremoricolorata]
MKRFCACLLLALWCLPGSAQTSDSPSLHARASFAGPHGEPQPQMLRWLWAHGPLRLGVIRQDNPPLEMLGSGQVYEGISADYAGLVAEHLRMEMRVEAFDSFEAAVKALRAGQLDLLASVSTFQAREAGLRLSRGYARDQPLLITRGAPAQAAIRGAVPFSLVVVDGYRPLSQLSAYYPSAQVRSHPSAFSAMAALALGRADAYLGSALNARFLLARNPISGVQEAGPARLPEEDIGFAMLDQDSPLPVLVEQALSAIDEQQQALIRQRWSPAADHAALAAPLQLSVAEQRWLQANPRVKVLVDEQMLPLSFRDGDGQLRGLSLDVLELISQRSGLQFEVEAGSGLQQMSEALNRGQAQVIAGVPRSPALASHLAFSGAYLSASRVLVTRDEAQAPESLEQLHGRNLAVVWGSAVQSVLEQQGGSVTLHTFGGPLAALHAVAREQVDAAVLTLDDARSLIARWYPGRLRISASLPMAPAHFALASRRGDVELQGILNKALLSLSPRESELLVRRWRNPLIVSDGLWPRYRGRIVLGFALVMALLSLAIAWIRYLGRLQVKLRRAKQTADRANQAKTRFLTTMSHEIRTPLHAMLGMLELAQLKAEQGALDHLALEVTAEAARSLLELIGDILDVSRIEAGQLQLAPQRVRLREQVEGVVQLFEQQARSKGLELRLHCQGAVDSDVLLDPVRFRQVLGNLLSNAIKFTARGWVEVHLRAVPEQQRLAVQLQVRDSGVGIAADELAQLGQPFRQASNQRQSPRCSSGLGLGISRSLCQMMEGDLKLHSELGQGTEVTICLTLPWLTEQPSRKVSAPQSPGAATLPLKVLVIDDYPANRLLLAQQLDYLGHQVRVAEDGAQGLRVWLQEPFDVVISDCNMPRLDGYALARAMREHERRRGLMACRLLGITANALPEERLRCRAAGMDDCLFKPLALGSLVQALDKQSGRCAEPEAGRVVESTSFDVQHLHRLVGADQAALRALTHNLRQSNRDDLLRLQRVGKGERTALAELAHRIKGGARIAGVERLAKLCEELERVCSQEVPWSQIQVTVQALAEAMTDLERSLGEQAARG